MSPSEIAFLSLGLVLGAAVGAAIVEAISRRPAPQREVRLTIVPNSIRQRPSATLAGPGERDDNARVPGSPDDSAWPEDPVPDGSPPGDAAARPAPGIAAPTRNRTPVPSMPVGLPERAVAIPVERPASPARAVGGDQPAEEGRKTSALAVLAALDRPSGSVDLRQASDPAPVRVSPAAVAVVGAATVREQGVMADPAPGDAPRQMAEVEARPKAEREISRTPREDTHMAPQPAATRDPEPPAPPPPPAAPASALPATSDADPCGAARTLVDERCRVAATAQDQAKAAVDVLRAAQREYDILRERVDAAQGQVDPRTIAAAKEALHREFRSATAGADGADATERAAREWLDQVNELNGRIRAATREVERGNAELRAAVPQLDRLSVDADVARIAAETAELACREAREALAGCEETVAAAAAAVASAAVADEPPTPSWPASAGPSEAEPPSTDTFVARPSPDERDVPAIVRVLRGDRAARDRLVAAAAGDDPATTGEWQLRIAQLVDAIVARAIEDGYLDLPDDAPFWDLFSISERRDVVGALSALGYRFDGLGGFADARVPAARDLSLAVGYAGLDRMRIRTWPQEDELGQLYARATVAADQWLAAEAGDLSLGLMVDALGARATDLADVWNAWGRLRPAMLSTG